MAVPLESLPIKHFDESMPLTEDEANHVLECIEAAWSRACFFLPHKVVHSLIDGTSYLVLSVLRCFDNIMTIVGLVSQPAVTTFQL